MFTGAKKVDLYYKEQAEKGIKFGDAMKSLELVRVEMAAYGDWYLYRDKDGNLWEDYFSIGD